MSETQPQLDPAECVARQARLRDRLAEAGIERAILLQHENVQWLTGFRPHRLMAAAVCLDVDGTCTLSAPNVEPEQAAADRIVTFEAQWLATIRQEQVASAVAALAEAIPQAAARTGVEFANCGTHFLHAFAPTGPDSLIDLEPEVWQLRRRKHDDELAMIRHAIGCTEAMYDRAREIIRPGITELEVFNELHAAAVTAAGEQLLAIGNDYQCNSPGGLPRPRAAQDGELFVLDLGPCYRGYYADNCRTIAVSGKPTVAQQAAWEAIVAVLTHVEQSVRPGVSCRELFRQAKAMLDEHRPGAFFHHLGHAFGLFPHEGPHLNENWDDTFEEGDVFTAEPGLYYDELQAGIRLEQNYVVTADGVERLTNFTLDL